MTFVKIATGFFIVLIVSMFLFHGERTVGIINALFDGVVSGMDVLHRRG